MSENQIAFDLSALSCFLTPFIIVSLLLGLIWLIKSYKSQTRLILFMVTSLLPYLYLKIIPGLKILITLYPLIAILSIQGLNFLFLIFKKYKYTILYIISISVLIPWFIGIKIYSSSTLWGPGFEIRSYDKRGYRPLSEDLHKRASYQQLCPTFNSGFAITTAEGVRPFWGHAYTLFGDALKRFNNKINNEAIDIINESIKDSSPIYLDKANPMLWAHLGRLGYWPIRSDTDEICIIHRRFYKGDDTLQVFYPCDPKLAENLSVFTNKYTFKEFIIYTTYSSTISRISNDLNSICYHYKANYGPFSIQLRANEKFGF
jgi:hypothetical protein